MDPDDLIIGDIEFKDVDDPDEELGYTDHDWSLLSEAECDSHDRIIAASADDLADIDEEALTDLERWALAQVLADSDDDEGFERVCRRIIESGNGHPAVDYAEICLELIQDCVLTGRFGEAEALLSDLGRFDNDPGMHDQLRIVIDVAGGRRDEGLSRLQRVVDANGDDPALYAGLAENLLAVGCADTAVELLEKAAELADMDNDKMLRVEIAAALQVARELLAEE